MNRVLVIHKNNLKWDSTSWNLVWFNEEQMVRYNLEYNFYIERLKLFNYINQVESTGVLLGEQCGMSRLTDPQVEVICKALEEGKII